MGEWSLVMRKQGSITTTTAAPTTTTKTTEGGEKGKGQQLEKRKQMRSPHQHAKFLSGTN